jgi:hypothetical protein
MSNSGWDIAMRRIDEEFDLPQSDASFLVRKISQSGFKLPPIYRARYQHLPEEVITRIEQIVREAYLGAGEDVGGDILREHLWQQALAARREMLASGELISEADFRQRLGVTPRRLRKLLTDGSVFTMGVDDVEYYPAVLAEHDLDRKRLQAICRMVVPAPPGSRLDFLVSTRGSLGKRSPLQMLDDEDDFKVLQQAAAAWAAEWSRTTVKMYEGEHEIEPECVQPLYTAAAESDPRKPLWERASEVLHVHGYQWPLGPYPDARKVTLFVERQTIGDAAPTPEACVQIAVDGDYIGVRIVAAPGTALHSETVSGGKDKSFIEVAKRAIAYLLLH